MPRVKKQRLKRRRDGRYCCKYHGMQFMGWTEDEALAAREEYKRQESEQIYLRSDQQTVGDYASYWLPIHKADVKPNTLKAYTSILSNVIPPIEHLRLCDVTSDDVAQMFSKLKGKSASYIHKSRILLTAIFQSAVDAGTGPFLMMSLAVHGVEAVAELKALLVEDALIHEAVDRHIGNGLDRESTQDRNDQQARDKIHEGAGHQNDQPLPPGRIVEGSGVVALLVLALHGAVAADWQQAQRIEGLPSLRLQELRAHVDGVFVHLHARELGRDEMAELMDGDQEAENQNSK